MTQKIVFYFKCQMFEFRVEKRQFLVNLWVWVKKRLFQVETLPFRSEIDRTTKKLFKILSQKIQFQRNFMILSNKRKFRVEKSQYWRKFLHFIGFNSSYSDLTRLALLARLEQLGGPLWDHLHLGTTWILQPEMFQRLTGIQSFT